MFSFFKILNVVKPFTIVTFDPKVRAFFTKEIPIFPELVFETTRIGSIYSTVLPKDIKILLSLKKSLN